MNTTNTLKVILRLFFTLANKTKFHTSELFNINKYLKRIQLGQYSYNINQRS